MRRYENDILHESKFFKNPNQPSRRIRLSPVHAMASGTREGVVIIVPTFAHSEQTEEPVISAGVSRFKGAFPEGVADRVHRPGDVLIQEESNKSAPYQTPE